MSTPECPIESLENTVATDPRDWMIYKRDAWLYGVIFGWRDAMPEVAAKHGWTQVDVARLNRLHKRWQELKKC